MQRWSIINLLREPVLWRILRCTILSQSASIRRAIFYPQHTFGTYIFKQNWVATSHGNISKCLWSIENSLELLRNFEYKIVLLLFSRKFLRYCRTNCLTNFFFFCNFSYSKIIEIFDFVSLTFLIRNLKNLNFYYLNYNGPEFVTRTMTLDDLSQTELICIPIQYEN